MRRSAQVVHVIKKDLREHWLALAVYVALIAVVAVNATRADGGSAANVVPDITAALLVLFGMVLVASLVQGDAPARANAFWATKPLDPFAVLAAKLALTVVVVIGIPLIAQFVGLRAHDVRSHELLRDVVASAWAYWKWLLIALLLSALTKDIKTFVLSLFTIPVFFTVAVIGVSRMPVRIAADPTLLGPMNPIREWAEMALGVIGCLALLLHMYRARDARPLMWPVAFMLLLACQAATGPLPAHQPSSRTLADGAFAHATFRLGKSEFVANGVSQFGVSLTPDSVPPIERLTLVNAVVTVTDKTGSVVRAPLSGPRTDMRLFNHALANVRWLGDPAIAASGNGGAIVYTDRLRQMVARGIASLAIEGRMIVRLPETSDTLELLNGYSAAQNGRKITISKIESTDRTASFTVSTESVQAIGAENAQTFSPTFLPDDDVEYALLNASRREAVALDSQGSSSSTGNLVLPGVLTVRSTALLSTVARRMGRVTPDIDADWLRGARLVVTHWAPKGSYPVHIETLTP